MSFFVDKKLNYEWNRDVSHLRCAHASNLNIHLEVGVNVGVEKTDEELIRSSLNHRHPIVIMRAEEVL